MALFALAGVGVLAVVGVSLYGRAEIIVTAAQNQASGEFVVTVRDLPFDATVTDPTALPGKISEQTVELSKTFPSTGTATTTGGAFGAVKLVNTTGTAQPLVATTRLLAPNGILLRLRERVVVPPNGQIVAAVYPDQPASFQTLAPTRMTIPGLSSVLQPKIFAESTTTLATAGGTVPVVTVQDLQQAELALTTALTQQAQTAFNATLGERERLYTKMVSQETVESGADAKVGDQRQEFTAHLQMKIILLAFNEERLAGVIRGLLSQQMPFTHQLVNVAPSSFRYETERYDAVRKEISLKVYAEGESALRVGSPILNPAVVAGLTKTQIINHFKQYSEIKSVHVHFTPEGLPRAPRSPSRITFTVR
ncbi:MAG: hypothetical protein PHI63_01155 [Patescibacteria group bacterium]|nr:hypothetical protein [Patescibacteria group bacterium]